MGYETRLEKLIWRACRLRRPLSVSMAVTLRKQTMWTPCIGTNSMEVLWSLKHNRNGETNKNGSSAYGPTAAAAAVDVGLQWRHVRHFCSAPWAYSGDVDGETANTFPTVQRASTPCQRLQGRRYVLPWLLGTLRLPWRLQPRGVWNPHM